MRDLVGLADAIVGENSTIDYWGLSYGTLVGAWFINSRSPPLGAIPVRGRARVAATRTGRERCLALPALPISQPPNLPTLPTTIMAPIAIDTPRDSTSVPVKSQVAQQQQSLRRTPLQLTGILDHFAFEESTPAIGREYTTLDIKKDLFEAPDSDARLRELAIISE